jgi:hypothetical protein
MVAGGFVLYRSFRAETTGAFYGIEEDSRADASNVPLHGKQKKTLFSRVRQKSGRK